MCPSDTKTLVGTLLTVGGEYRRFPKGDAPTASERMSEGHTAEGSTAKDFSPSPNPPSRWKAGSFTYSPNEGAPSPPPGGGGGGPSPSPGGGGGGPSPPGGGGGK